MLADELVATSVVLVLNQGDTVPAADVALLNVGPLVPKIILFSDDVGMGKGLFTGAVPEPTPVPTNGTVDWAGLELVPVVVSGKFVLSGIPAVPLQIYC